VTSLTSATQSQSGTADQSDHHGLINILLDLAAKAIAAQTDTDSETRTRARAALQASRHGVISISANGGMAIHNRIALDMLNLPNCPLNQLVNATEIAPQIAGLRILRSNENQDVELLQVSTRRFARLHSRRVGKDEVAVVIEDIDFRQEQTNAHRMAEAEYRSLFENAVCGIYRDQLDSTPVRCNPALAVLNGYKNEAEYIRAVTGAHGSWYVDPGRSDEFKRLMRTQGRVKDFVSEVYRHRTREKIWITENAWYVRDAVGNPIFIEGTIQDATERITTMAIIEREANLDALTGAASRYRFLREIEEKTVAGAEPCTLYSIDLDRFKEVNDIYGHAAGDYVLGVTAQRIQSLVKKDGLLARLGGDEFAILQAGPATLAESTMLAKSIVEAMGQPISVSGQNLIIGASVGVAMFPDHAANSEELLSNADMALYQVKTKGRGGHRIFDRELGSRTLRRKQIERELGVAVAHEELELHYQPIVECRTGKIVSCEALMRWNHPRRGLLQPDKFISFAEEAGLMPELGNWAIGQACRHAAILPPHIKMAVNVSPNQFRSSSILSALRRALDETGLDPKRLVLEITETAILSNEAIAEKVLDELEAMGVLLALDDFGTGYSSLSYLQRFAFKEVKIDQSFVAGMVGLPANLAVIRAVLSIGRDLGIDVVAEGVETLSQADALAREGCSLMQGYFFGRAKPYLEIVGDLAVQHLSQQLPAMDTSALAGLSKMARA
jgi:diguanylate cyclase (GGDEF)-like protein/PAS domain S-box-containing protein